MASRTVNGSWTQNLLARPQKRVRSAVLELLSDSYETGDLVSVHSGLAILFAHYGITQPFRVTFVSPSTLASRHKKAVLGDTDTKTGEIRLIWPKHWRRRRSWGSDKLRGRKGWMKVAVHEAAHWMMLFHTEDQAVSFERIVDKA